MMKDQIRSAQVVLPCVDFNKTLEFFTKNLGFRIDMISPADAPTTAVISGFGTTLRLETSTETQPLTITLVGDFPDQKEIVTLDGVRIQSINEESPLEIPEGKQEFIVTTLEEKESWSEGRAGMQYRDLIPGRFGGRFIASHIRIADSGKLLDYVHYHRVRFQMIFCLSGSAFVVYEDQGEPFLIKAGDLVLQPPEIRHKVLECSAGFEVLEISSPAVHETFADHEMKLPNGTVNRERLFDGQRFLHDNAAESVWKKAHIEGFEYRKTGMSEASGGLADARVIRALTNAGFPAKHSGEFMFFYMLSGSVRLAGDAGKIYDLKKGASFVVPSSAEYFVDAREGAEVLRLEITAN